MEVYIYSYKIIKLINLKKLRIRNLKYDEKCIDNF